jgi:hypothetical protein
LVPELVEGLVEELVEEWARVSAMAKYDEE